MFVGIDISKDSFDIAYRENGGFRYGTYEQCEAGYEGFIKHIKSLGVELHCVMEATGIYHLRLAVRLHRAGFKVSAINPLVIKRYGQMRLRRTKTDKADAQLICEYAEHNELPLWQCEEQIITQINQLDMWMESLHKQNTVIRNQLHAMEHQPTQDGFILKQMKRQLRQIQQQLEGVEQRMEELAKKYNARLYAILTSIKGIGAKTASKLIAITYGFTRFENVNQLLAYIGMSPRVYESGSSVKGRGSISKLGAGRLRQLLYMCSWSAKSSNKACSLLYERLKAKGKPEKVIKVAIAHKLLKQAFALARKNEFYDEGYAFSLDNRHSSF